MSAAPFARVGVVGAGSFGTALALVLQRAGFPVTVWTHRPEQAAEVTATGENAVYLPGVRIPPDLRFTAELGELAASDLLLVVVPSRTMREVSAQLPALDLPASTVLLSCTKGVERGTGARMSEILQAALPVNPVAVLSGPSHAEEVARQLPAAVVVGCGQPEPLRRLQTAFSTRSVRAYSSADVAGIELGGALKNIFAIGAGVCDGLGLGDSAKAALVTRSLAELNRVGIAMGGRRETFQGLSGIGDLIVTCFSRHSRNRMVGERLGRGEKLEEIVASMRMVAEGVPTTYSAHEVAQRLGIDIPIIEQTRALFDGQVSPKEALENLLGREPKPEI